MSKHFSMLRVLEQLTSISPKAFGDAILDAAQQTILFADSNVDIIAPCNARFTLLPKMAPTSCAIV
jgi:hypothetical protein